MQKIRPEQLKRILANKEILERFLTVLLESGISLRWRPTEAGRHESIHLVPDISAADEQGRRYMIYVGATGRDSIVEELQSYTLQLDDTAKEWHLILFTDQFDEGEKDQSYYRISPQITISVTAANRILKSKIHYHVFLTEEAEHPNAPAEIQQLLDALAGNGIASQELELLRMIQVLDFDWEWLDGLRFKKKELFRVAFGNSGYDCDVAKGDCGYDRFEIADIVMESQIEEIMKEMERLVEEEI